MIKIRISAAAILFFLAALSQDVSGQDTIYLRAHGQRPYMTVFQASAPGKDADGVLVCSGGSYGRTADEEEGIPAAKMLAANGITAFLLDYRIPEGKDSLPLADAQ